MNTLTLAVAGGRKTQSIVDACAAASAERRILVLTYTQRNQEELTRRLTLQRPFKAAVEVQGWFSFLLGHLIRPYLPMVFPGRRLQGLNFEGDPGRFATNAQRFLDSEGRAYKLHLAQLAWLTDERSSGAALDRLSRIYDLIYIDEVQDLNGYDLEILTKLMDSPIELRMVGDIRQAIINTNDREPKNAGYRGVRIKQWFDAQVGAQRLVVSHATTSWRCSRAIVELADGIFDDAWGFEPTTSACPDTVEHCGIFAVHTADASAYERQLEPLCLRYSAASWKELDLPFINIGVAKGAGVDHVLIAPTKPMQKFLTSGRTLSPAAACSLYVAVTRARYSVAFVSDEPAELGLTLWSP